MMLGRARNPRPCRRAPASAPRTFPWPCAAWRRTAPRGPCTRRRSGTTARQAPAPRPSCRSARGRRRTPAPGPPASTAPRPRSRPARSPTSASPSLPRPRRVLQERGRGRYPPRVLGPRVAPSDQVHHRRERDPAGPAHFLRRHAPPHGGDHDLAGAVAARAAHVANARHDAPRAP